MTFLPARAASPLVQIPSPPPPLPQQRPFVSLRSHANSANLQPYNLTADPTVSWTSSISTLSRNGQLAAAAAAFSSMRLAGVQPNHVTFVAILSGCAHFPSGNGSLGDLMHGYVCKLGLDKTHVTVGTAIIGMYTRRGCVAEARLVFDSMEVKNSVTWNAMIDGYMRSGQVDDAVKMFDEMPESDLISWTALINGFVKRGYYEEALAWFKEMQIARIEPDYVTIGAVLAACANLGALSHGLWVHCYVLKKDYKYNVRVSNSLIDMYSRCGCVEFAQEVFDKMDKRTLVSWNSIIVGFAANGYAQESLLYFKEMQKEGFEPDAVTFTGALTACSHAGLVEVGLHYFQTMKRVYKISPRIEHYGCLVDLYSRAGRLEDALKVTETMPMKPNEVVIGSLLAACRTHGNNTGLAERLMKHLEEMDLRSDSNYVTLANMYAADGKWDGASKLRRQMKGLGMRKQPGFSSVEIDGCVHEFMSGDRTHVETSSIYEVLELLSVDLGLREYVPENVSGELYDNN